MKLQLKFVKELINDFTSGSAAQKLNIIGNLFTIIGISVVFIVSKIILDKVTKYPFYWAGFLFFLSFLSIGAGLLIFLSSVVRYICLDFFGDSRFAFIIYVCILIWLWASAFGILFSIGLDLFNRMVFDPRFWGK